MGGPRPRDDDDDEEEKEALSLTTGLLFKFWRHTKTAVSIIWLLRRRRPDDGDVCMKKEPPRGRGIRSSTQGEGVKEGVGFRSAAKQILQYTKEREGVAAVAEFPLHVVRVCVQQASSSFLLQPLPSLSLTLSLSHSLHRLSRSPIPCPAHSRNLKPPLSSLLPLPVDTHITTTTRTRFFSSRGRFSGPTHLHFLPPRKGAPLLPLERRRNHTMNLSKEDIISSNDSPPPF